MRRAWKQDASQAQGWGAGDKGHGGSHQLSRSLADDVAFAVMMRPGRAEAPVSHPCHRSPRCLPPDGPAFGRPVPLSREERERTGEHTSHDFCLEVTHIALAHCPSAFVFGQVGTHNPPAVTGGGGGSHTAKTDMRGGGRLPGRDSWPCEHQHSLGHRRPNS